MKYAKVFKKVNMDSHTTLYLLPYDVENQMYSDLLHQAKNEGLSQVIINSEIMLDFLSYTIENGGIILKIKLNEYADEELESDIMGIVRNIRNGKGSFEELKENLSWALDGESIDITSITVALNLEDTFISSWEVFSNGIIIGENIEKFFYKHLYNVIGEYLNGEK